MTHIPELRELQNQLSEQIEEAYIEHGADFDGLAVELAPFVQSLLAAQLQAAADVCRKVLSRQWKMDAASSYVLVEADGITVADRDMEPWDAILALTPADAVQAQNVQVSNNANRSQSL